MGRNLSLSPVWEAMVELHSGGQLEVLTALGVVEESVGCPIISQMDVVKLGHTQEGIPVYIDKVAPVPMES